MAERPFKAKTSLAEYEALAEIAGRARGETKVVPRQALVNLVLDHSRFAGYLEDHGLKMEEDNGKD